ncbi:MAG TPA: PDZ domain-containing protein [Lacunisphaera sp.]|nr:PDZ domain-containing protein [Lacunisphaera sp.]
MPAYRKFLLPSLVLAAFVPLARAGNDVFFHRISIDSPRRIVIGKDDERMEKEKVPFLGIETTSVSRTLSAQLGLARDTGLVVTHIAEKSPAAEVLKEDDVLTKFDDQILVDQHQLGVLVRSKKEGDEVKLTVVRGGKEMTVKAKLALHEVPKMFGLFNGEGNGFNWQGFAAAEGLPGLQRLRELPGVDADEAQDVLRMIGRERGNFMIPPGVHIINRKGKGSTILDLPKSNIAYSDDDGSIEIKVDEGQRSLTVKDAKGKVAFAGPINTEEERKKLPADVVKRLEKLEGDTFNFEVGRDFAPEVVPLPPEPGKTKIGRELGRDIVRLPRPF